MRKLTSTRLKRIIAEEKKKLEKQGLISSDSKETKASDYANTLVNHIDFIQRLGIKEEILKKALATIREAKIRTKKKIIWGDR
tara:strand:- start:208 stop:456 length:249 start_codon:yes stop_codon:yes gene_type:complete